MRRSNLLITRSLFSVLTLLLAGSIARCQEYNIKLSRPDKVGDESITTVSASSAREATPTISGQAQPVQKDGFKAALHGTLKILAVNEKTGNALKETCTVDTLTKDGADLYPAGTIITVEKPKKEVVFTIDGAAVTGENTQVLQMLLHVDSPEQTLSDDDQMGSDKPQKVGDTWPINPENSAKDAKDDGVNIDPDHIKGQSKLEEVKKVGDTEVMEVSSTITADGVKVDVPGGTVSDGELTGKASFVAPTEPTGKLMKATSQFHMKMTVNLPGGVGKVDIVVDRDVTEERQPVKQ